MLNLNNGNKLLRLYVLASCLCLVCLSGCSKDVHDHPDLVTGEQLFDYHCAECHKKTGTGNFLKGIPANKETGLSRLQILHKVKNDGEVGSKMPHFLKMSDDEATKIVSHLKRIKL